MTTEKSTPKEVRYEKRVRYSTAASAPVYGMGLIGALVYYLQHAETIWAGLFGVIKAIVWPGMLVYEALKFLEL